MESLNWEDIKAYQWRGADDEKIELMLKARREIFLNIPLEHQARLDDILKVEVGLELPNRNYFRIPIPAKEQL